MPNSLQEDIARYGGKHGGLLHFRENVEGGKDMVLPPEILDPEQQFTWATRRRVWAACKETSADGVIVRTSEQSDWKGMVDTMPTFTTEKSWFAVRKAIDRARRACEDPQLLKYAEKEGLGYDPGRVTVSVTPYFHHSWDAPRTLITQHPSMDGVHLADVSFPPRVNPDSDWLEHNSFDFNSDGSEAWVYLQRNTIQHARQALSVARWVENADVLTPREAFQFEGGSVRGVAKLFQIRHLADKRSATFELDQRTTSWHRDFGTTPEEGVIVKVARYGTRDGFAKFEAENPGTDYALVVDTATEKLRLLDQPSGHMRSYMIYNKAALSHQATRLVNMALRNPHGTTSLFSTQLGVNKLRPGSTVRIIADGVRQRIELLD